MVVAQHHAQLGLPVMIVDGGAEPVGEPADHLRRQRLAGAADRAQAPLQRSFRGRAGGHQQAIGGGRSGKVGDAVVTDDPAGAFHAERPFVEGGRMAHGEGTGDSVVEAVGPARIGEVPEGVLGAQVHRLAQVADEGEDRLERHRHRFGQAGGAGGEHHQERILAAARNRFEFGRIALQLGPEAEIAATDALPLRSADGDGQRRIGEFVELVAVGRIGDQHLAAGGRHAVFDGLRAEGGEQRLVHRAQAPGAEDGDQKLGRARQQAGDAVARAYALGLEEIGETSGERFQLAEGIAGATAILALPEQRDPSRQGMPVAAFDAGVERLERTGKRGGGGPLQVEPGGSGGVVAHCRTPRLVFVWSSRNLHAVADAGQCRKASICLSGLDNPCWPPAPPNRSRHTADDAARAFTLSMAERFGQDA
ncbi:hypothetical protein PAERUG_P48_London_17_VIM_2_01_13_02606 [Pseudomonas aeruginosa]|nr:hypothetical protein PAERUG_P48_London_17_VIM_2_01_13_02606 [Pseudomonas aeruginosa]